MVRITIIAIATFVLGFAAFTGVDYYTHAQAAPPPKTPTPTPGPAPTVPRLIPLASGVFIPQTAPNELAWVPIGAYVDVRDCEHLDLFLTASVSNNTLAPPQGAQGWLAFGLELSSDGTTTFGFGDGSNVGIDAALRTQDVDVDGTVKHMAGRYQWNAAPNPASPYVRVIVATLSTSNGGADATVEAMLYCT